MDATLSLLSAPRTIVLRIPSADPASACRIASRALDEDGIGAIEAGAAAQQRSACAKAALARLDPAGAAGSSEDSDLDLDEDDGSHPCTAIRVQTLPVAASIGGKIWDASLLMAAWLTEEASRRQLAPLLAAPAGRPPRVLELGSGLGVVGLAFALAYPSARVVLSDYDPAVLANLRASLELNATGLASRPQGGGSEPAEPSAPRIEVEMVDFRHFAAGGDASLSAEARAARYAGLLGGVDLIVGADIVYEQSHAALGRVCDALLSPSPTDAAADWRPCAIFVLPDSRPRLGEFVASLRETGLECRVERVLPSPEMVRRLRRAHEGWAQGGASFSLYHVARPVARAVAP